MARSLRETSTQRNRAGATVLEAEDNRKASLELDLDPTQLPFKRNKETKAPKPFCERVVNSTEGCMQEGGSFKPHLSPQRLHWSSVLMGTQRTA